MRAQRIGDELRREPTPRECGAGREGSGDAAHAVAPAQRVGGQGHRGQTGQGEGQRPAADVMRGRGRRDDGQAGDAGDDRTDGQHVARADRLVERPRAQHQEQHETEGERGLHDGERSEQQRGGLQRPTDHPERRAGQPPRLARQIPDQRRPQPLSGRHHPRLERLQRDAEVVHHGRGTRGEDAEHEGGHDSTPR
jgi:hypothetical protein